jgi:hypothetical protein
MPSSSSFSHRHARASALTSVLLGCGLPTMRLRPPWRWTRERFRLAAALPVSLLSPAAR